MTFIFIILLLLLFLFLSKGTFYQRWLLFKSSFFILLLFVLC